jgi:A/G-specific adenine glycosylase
MNMAEIEVAPEEFSSRLLEWYASAKRTLPWREHAHDPYAVWISEIMLQQTTVAASVSYFNRWMERFPNVQCLAESSVDEVLRYWAGLGYYSRARNIHKASQIIVERFGGRLPKSTEELIALPGIGRYTAGAIASIAFGLREAVVDVNVRRILARVYGLNTETPESEIWRIAQELAPTENPGFYNQALMDLGATICTPKAPKCSICPVMMHCAAGSSGVAERFDPGPKMKAWKSVVHVSLAVVKGSKVLVCQRSIDLPLWPGLWELPRKVVPDCDSETDVAKEILAELGLICAGELNKFTNLRHVVTNNKIKLACYIIDIKEGVNEISVKDSNYRWVSKADAAKLALSAPQKRLIAKLAEVGII